jgi:hypothetical protein
MRRSNLLEGGGIASQRTLAMAEERTLAMTEGQTLATEKERRTYEHGK